MKRFFSLLLAVILVFSISANLVSVKAASKYVSPFTDVPTGTWFSDPVTWAVNNHITNGTSRTTFSPYQTCTVAQILTFVYRASEYTTGGDNWSMLIPSLRDAKSAYEYGDIPYCAKANGITTIAEYKTRYMDAVRMVANSKVPAAYADAFIAAYCCGVTKDIENVLCNCSAADAPCKPAKSNQVKNTYIYNDGKTKVFNWGQKIDRASTMMLIERAACFQSDPQRQSYKGKLYYFYDVWRYNFKNPDSSAPNEQKYSVIPCYAIGWAALNGITNGAGKYAKSNIYSFGAMKTCTRAEIVTFLYRAVVEPYYGFKGSEGWWIRNMP